MKPYSKEIAQFYDIIVHGRDHVEAGRKEIQFIERAFEKFFPGDVKEILDVGCGNGRFLIPLVREGYTVTGLDFSKDMLSECDRRLKKQHLQADLLQKDLETMDFDSEYDALLCMDSVICYILEPEAIIETLKRFRRALRPHGILIIENWNMLDQWNLLGKTHSYTHSSKNTKIQWQERDWYDTFLSIFHIEVTGTVSRVGICTPFHHEEVLKVLAITEMGLYLEAAGFAAQFAYPSYHFSKTQQVNSEVMLFLALSP
ncbi:MAG: class I SAM-dependent methyltransferase [Theionarchaea archaeon]|nr:MAG: hypothetical protein AYK18_05385 [Theionarchaea archaeon DG-70]MBU7009192.1 class I SAM-dependent methyltransferase [Theionarchaea archaeon]